MAENVITRTPGVDRMGTAEERQRVYKQLCVAFNIPDSDAERRDVVAALTNAMNQCILYGLVPQKDCYMVPYKTWNPERKRTEKVYTFMYSIHGLRLFRDRKQKVERTVFDIQFEDMTEDEIKLAQGDEYRPGTVGVRARWIDFSAARLYKDLGMKYSPRTYRGFWKKESYEAPVYVNGQKTDQKEWKPDPLQKGRTPHDVAERRAERMALIANVSPIALDDYNEERGFARLQAQIHDRFIAKDPEPPASADKMIAPPDLSDLDENLMPIETDEAPGDATIEHEPMGNPEIEFGRAEEIADLQSELQQGEPEPEPVEEAEGYHATLIEATRKLEKSPKRATKAQYGFLVASIDDASGVAGVHGHILEELAGRKVTQAAPCSAALAARILDKIVDMRVNKKTGEKEENEDFDMVLVAHLQEMAEALTPDPA